MDDSNRSTGGRFWPQAYPPLSAVSDNCLGTQHSALWPRRRVVLQRHTQIVCRYSTPPARTAQAATRRHFAIRSQRRAQSARYKDGSSGGAASIINHSSPYFWSRARSAWVEQSKPLLSFFNNVTIVSFSSFYQTDNVALNSIVVS